METTIILPKSTQVVTFDEYIEDWFNVKVNGKLIATIAPLFPGRTFILYIYEGGLCINQEALNAITDKINKLNNGKSPA